MYNVAVKKNTLEGNGIDSTFLAHSPNLRERYEILFSQIIENKKF
jgi:hypothetical protein